MKKGRILNCCKIPINTDTKTIGNNTVRKKGASPSFAKPQKTNDMPVFA